MAIVLHHHPRSRASTVIWMLEEVGVDYEIAHVDLPGGAQKTPEHLALNPMGKLPVLVDDETVVTEVAAIGLYLADRYALGRLAPQPDDPDRGAYLRWSCFAPSVLEPCAMASRSDWEYPAATAGWGSWPDVLATLEHAIGDGPFLLGETFSMADLILGGTMGWFLQFGMLDAREPFTGYVGRLHERPSYARYQAINQAEPV